MAVLDLERNVVVVRLVYDGPPEAGKTTSLRSLAGSFNHPLFSPEERDGRTLYFDWLDYTAGRFEGYQIRCQIVSAPGQKEFLERRRRLISEADALVCVADTTRGKLDEALACLKDVPGLLAGVGGPPIGMILQANKRDLPEAVPLPELRARLEAEGHRLGVVESIAAEGAGIRETFVFAVRLALDRVRELIRSGALPSGRPEIDDGPTLYASMQASERQAPAAIAQVLAENAPPDPAIEAFVPWRAESLEIPSNANGEHHPRPPDPTAPSGAIWPPVDGRVTLHEAASVRLTTHKLRNGGWAAGIGTGWRAYSSGAGLYPDVESGRAALIQWARLHAACGGVLSPRRCVVLADTGDGAWRLWQIVRAEASLRDYLGGLERRTSEEAAIRLTDAAAMLLEMDARLAQSPCQVQCSLDTIGRVDGQVVYIGLMPSEAAGPVVPSVHGPELVRGELSRLLVDVVERRPDVLAALDRSLRHPLHRRGAAIVKETLGGLPPRA